MTELTALGLLSLILGVVLLSHGLQKITRTRTSNGLANATNLMGRIGFKTPKAAALFAAASEITAGLCFITGIARGLGGIIAVGVMATVILTTSYHNGYWAARNGVEFPGVLLLMSAILAFTPPGTWAVADIEIVNVPQPWILLGLLGSALAAVALAMILRRSATRPHQHTPTN